MGSDRRSEIGKEIGGHWYLYCTNSLSLSPLAVRFVNLFVDVSCLGASEVGKSSIFGALLEAYILVFQVVHAVRPSYEFEKKLSERFGRLLQMLLCSDYLAQISVVLYVYGQPSVQQKIGSMTTLRQNFKRWVEVSTIITILYVGYWYVRNLSTFVST
jgi:hypothetical protein